MSVVVVCVVCGAEFTATREEIVRGGWQVCPRCRTPEPAPPPLPDERRAKRMRARDWRRLDREARRAGVL